MPWSLHELPFSEGTQALFCANAEQGVSPLIWIFPPISFSAHGNAHLSCQQLGLCSPDPFAEQLCTMAQIPQGWQEPTAPTFTELEVWHILVSFFCFPVLCFLCADIPAHWGQ